MRRVAFAALLLALFAADPAAAQTVEARVTNGNAVAQGQYPWTVALVLDSSGQQFCGGTLIKQDVVLTAAHCTVGLRPGAVDVIAGAVDLDAATSAHRRDVVSISLHPEADVDDDDRYAPPRRDLSLLRLSSPAPTSAEPLTQVADPDQLAAANRYTITGWGAGASGGPPQRVLRSGALRPVGDLACAGVFGSAFHATDQLCAAGSSDSGTIIDACQGDSGGPLALPIGDADPGNPAQWRLGGTTSWGAGCATQYPGVYARVPASLLRGYVLAGQTVSTADDAPPQPVFSNGTPRITGKAVVGESVECGRGTLVYDDSVIDQLEYLVRRLEPDGDVETVSFSGVHLVGSDDVGSRLYCELRGRRAGAGGYARALSSALAVPTPPTVLAPAPERVEVPVPVRVEVPVPVPGPTVFVSPSQLGDRVAPHTTSVGRACKKRDCTFTVKTADATPSAGIATVAATLSSTTTRTCRRGGRRVSCKRTTTTGVRAVRVDATTFRLSARRLARGQHLLLLSAVDSAGNVQAAARRVAFRVR